MELDEIYFKRMENLRNNLASYIENTYFGEFNNDEIIRLNYYLEECDKDGRMLDYITMQISIEGELEINCIDKCKLEKNISRVIFNEFSEELIEKTDFKLLKNSLKEEILDKHLKVKSKEFIINNAKDLFTRDLKSLNEVKMELIKNKLSEKKRHLNIIK